jgi:solute carrier family 20 (sodium-dependent phosphate transporter)
MFAHGSNDVANSIAPFAGTYLIWRTGSVSKNAPTPQWILAVGGISMSLGLATYGYKVMRTMGTKMTKLSNSRGLCIELSSSSVVLVASALGIPVSTTQIATGGIMAVGMIEGRGGVNWGLMLRVFFGWAMTLVFTGVSCYCLVSFCVNGPEKLATDRRVSMATTLRADAVAYAALLNSTAHRDPATLPSGLGASPAQLSAWGAEILENRTGPLLPPHWRLEPYEAALNYTCSRAFVALGLLQDPPA